MNSILEAMADSYTAEFDRLISLHHNTASTMDIKLFRRIASERAMAAALRKAAKLVMQDGGLKEGEVLDIRDWLTAVAEQVP